MRDAHQVPGRKRFYYTLEGAHAEVLKTYPEAGREGSVGAWSWLVGEKIVAEAWIHATLPGWWVRIRSLKPEATKEE